MDRKADMLIYHAPDVLEFVGNGRSLLSYQTPHAHGCLMQSQAMPSGDRKHVINDLYTALLEQQRAATS